MEGNSLLHSQIDKIREISRVRDKGEYDWKIQVDGGINHTNIQNVAEAGADIAVAGSSVFSSETSVKNAIKMLQTPIKKI